MNKLEKSSLQHAADWLNYSKSPQAKRDAEIDRKRRANADKTNGHLSTCSLSKCDSRCLKGK